MRISQLGFITAAFSHALVLPLLLGCTLKPNSFEQIGSEGGDR